MKYFTRSASLDLSNWRGRLRWDKLWARYDQELARVRDEFTPGWRELADTDFHDSSILAFERPNDSEAIVRLDMGGPIGEPPTRVCTLQFLGVTDVHASEAIVGDRWLYAEVHLTADGCGSLHVLLYRTEMQIVAYDVALLKNYEEEV